jgi:hypothetical protein
MIYQLSNTVRVFAFNGTGDHSLREYLNDGSIAKPSLCAIVSYLVENSILNSKSDELVPINGKILSSRALKYNADFDSIEETITDLLLKNKNLFNDNIINFVYENEELIFENKDIITKFNENPNYEIKQISTNDKLIFYTFYKDNFENKELLLQIINDFIQLIIFINNNNYKGIKNIYEFFDVPKKII